MSKIAKAFPVQQPPIFKRRKDNLNARLHLSRPKFAEKAHSVMKSRKNNMLAVATMDTYRGLFHTGTYHRQTFMYLRVKPLRLLVPLSAAGACVPRGAAFIVSALLPSVPELLLLVPEPVQLLHEEFGPGDAKICSTPQSRLRILDALTHSPDFLPDCLDIRIQPFGSRPRSPPRR